MSDRAALAALSDHFTPDQVAADLARYSPTEVWQQRVRLDNAGCLAQWRPCDTPPSNSGSHEIPHFRALSAEWRTCW
ncbi:hypothetical protein ACFXKC_10790 [Streptomyces sp. NPDC059340]|uniref:hypothetical protein n=1 Tax=Streptomyces sp. NPDC059340 TaxID=3346806 RepID=UPI0036AC9D82